MTYTIAFEENAPSEDVIELVAADDLVWSALDGLGRTGGSARFVRRARGPAMSDPLLHPGLVVVAGDLRRGGTTPATLARLRRPDALSVAVVAFAPSQRRSLHELRVPGFDAVLPVLVHDDTRAASDLGTAVTALTAFAAGDRVSMSVDDVYPFYARGGCWLSWGCAEADDAERAARNAITMLTGGDWTRAAGVRILLHIETTAARLLADMRSAADVVQREMKPEDFGISASQRAATSCTTRVLLVASFKPGTQI